MGFYAEEGIDNHIRSNFFMDFSYKGVIVEVGGGDPEWGSISKHFYKNGWKTIVVEPNPKYAKQHLKDDKYVINCACSSEIKKHQTFYIVKSHWTDMAASSLGIKENYKKYAENIPIEEIKIDVYTLNYLLEERNIDKVDILSIDTEGWEIEVMRGFDLKKYKPKVVVLENFSNDQSYDEYMTKFNYFLIGRFGFNSLYEKR